MRNTSADSLTVRWWRRIWDESTDASGFAEVLTPARFHRPMTAVLKIVSPAQEPLDDGVHLGTGVIVRTGFWYFPGFGG
jgi:hypothetical protein